MKRIFKCAFFWAMIATLAIIGCKNDKGELCTYKIGETCISLDSNLYISYEINGEKFKYYQGDIGGGVGSTGHSSSGTIIWHANYCGFDTLFHELKSSVHLCNPVGLYFVANKMVVFYDILKSEYKFTFPRQLTTEEYTSEDTKFMDGVSLTIPLNSTFYSTQNIMEYYNYDYDIIYNDILKPSDSYLKVNNIQKVCDNNYLVQGEFVTRLMKNPSQGQPPEMVEVKKGKFQILAR